MNRTQIVALANAVAAIRPDWQQTGIVAQITTLANTWAGSDGALSAHVMSIAAHPQSQTPGAFNTKAPESVPSPTHRYDSRYTHEPMCHTCSRPKSACIRQREWEFQRGIPDPHAFETLEDAERNTSRRTA